MYLGQLEDYQGGREKRGSWGKKRGETAVLWESVLGKPN